MSQVESGRGSLGGIRNMRRRSVEVSPASLVKMAPLFPDRLLPLAIEPAGAQVDLPQWATENRDLLEEKLLQHGAILFHNFGLQTPAHFEATASAICENLFSEYGDLPREGVSTRVYESTPYPSDKTILFHNESSHLPSWPRKQFFMCMLPSREGGFTPLLDCREVYRELDPAIRDKFEQKGLMYIRHFVPGFDVSWQEFFHTEDRQAVEAACANEGMECDWTTAGGLRIRQRGPAVITHPKTGEKSFFNQVQLHHPSCLDAETRESLYSLFKADELPRNVLYGDGTPIEDDVMARIDELYWKLCVKFPWSAGDLILVDNMLVSHARTPYVGPRKIIVAMGDMHRATQLA